jgi:CheY-like chemotaxis protein
MRVMTVLVVEDDDAVRLLIAATLPERWTVLEARDGMEGIAVARRRRPDAILLDHELPMLEGTEVCRVLRREDWCRRTRIIALTASSDGRVRQAFAEAGADAFLNKPFSPVQLLDLLDAWEREVV